MEGELIIMILILIGYRGIMFATLDLNLKGLKDGAYLERRIRATINKKNRC